jgi:hypothetical protein
MIVDLNRAPGVLWARRDAVPGSPLHQGPAVLPLRAEAAAAVAERWPAAACRMSYSSSLAVCGSAARISST